MFTNHNGIINGLPNETIRIEVSETELARLGLSLNDIARSVGQTSLDVPAGRLADGALRVRSLGLLKTPEEYEDIEIIIRPDGSRVLLGNIARITDATINATYVSVSRMGENAIELEFRRGKTNDSLEINQVIQDWLADYRLTAPENLNIEQYDIRANLIQERISLLVKNGAGGLVLVIIVLFIFLSGSIGAFHP